MIALWMFEEREQIKIDNKIFSDARREAYKNTNTLQEYGKLIERNVFIAEVYGKIIGKRPLIG